jgi:hypothetical protein
MTTPPPEVKVDDSETIEAKLPPMPVPFRPRKDTDIEYKGDLKDYKKRCMFKLYALWMLWAELRCNPKIEELVAREETDKESDAFLAKHCIVDIINQLALVLSASNIMDEIAWLSLNEEEFEERQKNLANYILEQLKKENPTTK